MCFFDLFFNVIAIAGCYNLFKWLYPPHESPQQCFNFLVACISFVYSYMISYAFAKTKRSRAVAHTLTPQSEDVRDYGEPRHYGKKYKYFTFDQRLGDMDVLADLPQRMQKRKRRYIKRLDRETERLTKQQHAWQVQSGEGLFAGLGAIRNAIGDTDKGEFVVKLLEDVILLTYQLSRSRSKLDMSVAVTAFAKLRMSRSLSMTVSERLLEIKFSELFSEQEVQSADEYFMPLREMLDNYTNVRSLPVFKKMYKFSMYALSLSLFDSMGVDFDTFGYSQVEKAYIKRKFTKSPDFVHCLLDTTLFVCERGYQCFITRSFQPLVHSGSAYEKWMDEAKLLKLQSTCLMNPKAHGFTYFDFLSRLNDNIEKGEAIVSFFRHSIKSEDRSEGHLVQRLLDNLRLIRASELTKRAAREGRPAPFATLVYGGSSVGKSTFSDILFNHFGKTFDLPTEPEYKYTRIFTDSNWSGFHTSMWCIVMDDLAFRKAGYALGDISLDEMIQIINNVSFTPPQADLPDKGKIPLRSEFVIATTNAEHLNAYSYFHNALAVQRRLPYVIEISPKEEYTRDKVFLDSAKVPALVEGEYPDLWNITVKRVVPFDHSVTTQMATHEVVNTFTDVNEFLSFYMGVAAQHRRVQDKVMMAGNNMSTLQVCKSCFYTASKCSCETPDFSASRTMSVQSGDFDGMLNQTLQRENHFFDRNTLSGNVSYIGLLWMYVLVYIVQFCVFMATRSNWTGYFLREIFAWCITTRFFNAILMYVSRRMVGSMSRRWLRIIGDRSTALLAAPAKLITVITSLTLILGVYKTYSAIRNSFPRQKEEEEPKKRERLNSEMTMSQLEHSIAQGNVQSTSRLSDTIGSRPAAEGNQKESVWMKNDYVTSRDDVNPLSIGWNSLEFSQVLSNLDRNCCTFIARRDVNGSLVRRNNRAVCVGGQIFMTNNHGLPTDCDIDLEVIFSSPKDGVNPNLRMIIRQNMIYRIPEKDLAFIELRNLPPFKNIAALFPNEKLFGKYTGSYVAKDEMGSSVKFPVNIYSSGQQHVESTDSAKFDREYKVWWAQADRDTVRGDCGSLMVAQTSFGPTILGIHFLGGGNKVVAALAITRADVEQGMKHFGEFHVQNGPPALEAKGFPRPLIDLHQKASIRYIPDGSAKVYGSFAGMRANHKSRVTKTYICEAMQSRGYSIKTGAPVMRGWEPWNLALKDMVHPTCNIEEDLLDDCVESFTREILERLPLDKLKNLMILDNDTAVNGAPGVGFIDKMNRNTSMGNPWKKSKKNFMKAMAENDVWQDGVQFTDDVLDRVDDIIGKYQQGIRTKPNFCAHLKDEAVAFRKIAACKTRVFTGAPADWSLVVRKYLLSFVKLVQDNRYVFEAGPGTICQSLEWEEMYEFLTQHGVDNIIAGDYGKFDKKMIAAFILAAFDIIINIHRAAGWSEEQLRVLSCIAMDTAFPLVDFNGDLIEFFGTNPSGHPLTVIINSLVNALYMRYCYAKCAPIAETTVMRNSSRSFFQLFFGKNKDVAATELRQARMELLCTFKDFVSLMTYGDDNVMGVSSLIPWFNHTTIQTVLASIGVEYTMADKESESVPYISIDDVAFLKRRWRWDADVGAMLAPLEHDSIEKMLTMWVASTTVCAPAQAVDVIESALNEYFFYGKDVYEAKRSMMIDIINETQISAFVTKVLSLLGKLYTHVSGTIPHMWN
uniref:RNA-dependent RNA polymerase n=1 Tax=Picornavirales sp. TaxID=1955153 RepID=A0A514D1Z8_9VIRU|nr:MAG: RNA-dependent RNA polymerase [Picornavirales sp.]